MIRLLRLQARRDRVILPIWILGIALLVTASTSAIGAEYGTRGTAPRSSGSALVTPALLALRGAPNGAELGSLLFFQVFTFLAVTVGLMSTFLATRHGRADEERGRRELVIASPGRPRSSSLVGDARARRRREPRGRGARRRAGSCSAAPMPRAPPSPVPRSR